MSDDRLTRELRRLERTAEVGQSDRTPLILTGAVALVGATVFLALLALALLAYRLAS